MKLLDGKKLKKVRKSSLISEDQILKRLNLKGMSYIWRLEKNAHKASFETVLRLARAYEVPLKELLSDEAINLIMGLSHSEVAEAKAKYQSHLREYPIIGDYSATSKTAPDYRNVNTDNDLPTVSFASFREKAIYAIRIKNGEGLPKNMQNSVVLINPRSEWSSGDYCLIRDIEGKSYIRRIKVYEMNYVLEAEGDADSVLLHKSVVKPENIHKVVAVIHI